MRERSNPSTTQKASARSRVTAPVPRTEDVEKQLAAHVLPLQKWLQHLRAERQLAPSSVLRYESNLARILHLLAAMQAGRTIDLLLPAHALRDAIGKLHRGGLSGKSLAQVLASVRSYGRFLQREGLIDAQPADSVRAPKSKRKLPTVLDADAARTLVDLPLEDSLSVRDHAMLELLYSSALRLSELVSLDWQDVDLRESEVRVLGKGQKTRIVPIGTHALDALKRLREQATSIDGAVFLARGKRISPRAVQLRLKVIAKKRGVFQRIYPHLFRHSSASHLLESSGDLRAVQEFLGHADIRTTQIYTHLNFQHLAQVYDAAHPRARRRTSRSAGALPDSDPLEPK